jgi:hypothetical protein
MPDHRNAQSARDEYTGVVTDKSDFRDRIYVPSLVDVPLRIPLARYRRCGVPMLDQGREASCTGFGLATVAHFLLRRRKVDPDPTPVSPRMLYEMAKRYDEWKGAEYQGSSARGAIKGWHKHGVCAEALWPYVVRDDRGILTHARAVDATRRPLGAYFRVGTNDLAGMHSALAEVGILYVTARVHEGWHQVGPDGAIPWPQPVIGAHAFALVAYDEHGFWLQNSRGAAWGVDGFARISYADWLANGQDVWVARLGVPIAVASQSAPLGHLLQAGGQHPQAFALLRPYLVTLGRDGAPRPRGTFATTPRDIAAIIGSELPDAMRGWRKRRVLLYAPNGLSEETALLRAVGDWRTALLAAEIYPLAVLGETGIAAALQPIVEKEASADGCGASAAERRDAAIEQAVRRSGGEALWRQAEEHAARATTSAAGGLRLVAQELAALAARDPELEIHLLAHGAGALAIAWLVPLLTGRKALPARFARARGLGLRVASLTLWVPACSTRLFRETVLPAVADGSVGALTLFTLSEDAERQASCAGRYGRSWLSLIAGATGEALLGLAAGIDADAELRALFGARPNCQIAAPDTSAAPRSAARRDDDFATDSATLETTAARILAAAPS